MSDEQEQGGIRQKAEAIATESAIKSAEIAEGAKQILGGDVRGGLANILKAASDLATNATEKGLEIAAEVVADRGNKPSETTETTET